MPVYEYKCECSPEKIVSKERSISSIEPSYLCPSCGQKLHRNYTPFGIKFNGSGFYKTDNIK